MRGTNREIRVWWLVLGGLILLLNLPLSGWVVVAFGVPWLAVLGILHAAGVRAANLWLGLVASAGGRAVVGLIAAMLVGVGFLVGAAPAVILGLWTVAGLTIFGLWRGPGPMRLLADGGMLSALAVVLFLGATEAVLRWRPIASQIGGPSELAEWDRRYDRLWERNALGFRSPYEVLAKEPDVTRVLALGDSFTWGDKIAHSDSTWPAQLEVVLTEAGLEKKVEVVNLGRNAFTTVNEAEMLRRIGWQFDPDVVIVQFYVNDIYPSAPDFQSKTSSWLVPNLRLLPSRFRTVRIRQSATLHFAESRLNAFVKGGTWDRRLRSLYETGSQEWDDLVASLAEMGAEAARRNVPIILMMFPHFFPGEPTVTYALADIHDTVGRAARDAGFQTLDLVPVYSAIGRDWRSWWATPYDSHPSAEAAGVAARAVAPLVLRSVGSSSQAGVRNGSSQSNVGVKRITRTGAALGA